MKKRTLIRELGGFTNKTATVNGWLHKRRLLGSLNFLILRDRTGLVQILVEDKRARKIARVTTWFDTGNIG